MQEENKKPQKTMQIKDKGINNFIINKGLNNILFSHSEKELLSLLGKPKEEEYDKIAESKSLFYDNFMIVLHYIENKVDYMSIHLNSLNIFGTDISLLSKVDLVDTLRKIYRKEGKKYKYEYEEDEFEELFFFESLGLSVWYQDSFVSDICIHEVMNE